MSIGIYDLRLNSRKKLHLVKVADTEYPADTLFTTTEKVCDAMEKIFDVSSLTEEHMFLMCCNIKMKAKQIFDLSHGTSTEAWVNPKGIFQRALLGGADAIIVVHNHPSGDVQPSREDEIVYRQLKDAAHLLEIQFIDHIIMGGKNHYSFREIRDGEE